MTRVLGGIAAIVLTGCLTQVASAQGNNAPVVPLSQIVGAPLILQRNLPAGVYIRREGNEIFIFTHAFKERAIVFTGRITVESGPIVKPTPHLLEKDHKEGVILKAANILEFRFLTLGEVDGLSFRAPNGQKVTIELFADGRPVPEMAFGGKPEWLKGNKVIIDLNR